MINYALEFVLYLLRITLGEPLWNNTSSVLRSRRRAVVAIKSRILYSRLLPVVPHISPAFSIPPFTRCHSRIPHSRFLPIATWWWGVTINSTGPTPDSTGPVPGQKWLIISLQRLLRVEFRRNSEPTVLGLQLNKQETLNTSHHQLITSVN